LIEKEKFGGGAGNRTRVRRYYTHASTCVGCLLIVRPRDAGSQASRNPISLNLASGPGAHPLASLLIDAFPGTQATPEERAA
jgi:hypothetical protein